MTTQIDQKVYLQKYLSGPSNDKKKKKKKEKKAIKGKGFKIIDDDLDLSKLRALGTDELDMYGEGEDAPQVAGIIDDRPLEMRKLDQFKTSTKWRVINQDDGFNSNIQIEEIKQSAKEVEKENEIIFGKMYSDSEDERERESKKQSNDSDASPPRKSNKKQKNDSLNKKSHKDNDSDTRPPGNHLNLKQSGTKTNKHERESKKNADSDGSPPRRPRNDDKQSRHNDDSDISPPRKSRSNHDKESRKDIKKTNYDSDASPPRKSRSNHDKESRKDIKKTNYNSDASPPRKSRSNHDKESRKDIKKTNYDSDASPPRKSRGIADSDESPPRKSRKNDTKQSRTHNDTDPSLPKKHTSKQSNSRRKQSINYDSDASPPRKSRKQNHDRDLSPPKKRDRSPKRDKNRDRTKKSRWGDFEFEKNEVEMINKEYERKSKTHNDSDASPPRKRDKNRNSDSDLSPPRKNTERDRNSKNKDRYSSSPPPTNKKMEKTLDGKMAGLQDARQLRMENESFRRRENEVFNKMADDVSGRNAQAVSRKGKRETSEDRNKQREKAERQREIDDKYKKWSKGLKQIENQQERMQDYAHEASKPLARHKGDRDLEERLKDIERDGDPMLKYIRERKREMGILPPERPSYKGSFPPNRFNIRPGHRWDGVDRSNGYEKKYFDQQSKRKAQEEDAYKWSTEDL